MFQSRTIASSAESIAARTSTSELMHDGRRNAAHRTPAVVIVLTADEARAHTAWKAPRTQVESPPLEKIRSAIDAPTLVAPDRMRGLVDGHEVEVRFLERYQNRARYQRTELVLPGALVRDDLELAIGAQREDDARDAAEGRGVDLRFDDPAFDAAFLVEAAPADVVRRLLEPPIRARMLALEGLAITTRTEGLCLEVPRWIDDAETLRALASLGAAVVDRAPLAFERADAAHEFEGGLRGATSPTARHAARRAEIATLRAKIASRGTHRERQAVRLVIGTLMFCAFVALIAWLTRS